MASSASNPTNRQILDKLVAVMPDDHELIGLKEAADILGVHVNTVRNWGAQGRLEETRVGPRGDRRYLRAEVEQLREKLEADRLGRTARLLPSTLSAIGAIGKIAFPPSTLLQAASIGSQHVAAIEAIGRMALPPSTLLQAAGIGSQHVAAIETIGRLALPPSTLLQAAGIVSQYVAAIEAIGRTVLPPSALLAEVALVSHPLITHQLSIAANLERIAGTVQFPLDDNLIVTAAHMGRIFSQIDGLAVAGGPASIVARRAASFAESFDGFAASIADRLPPDPGEGVTGIAIGELSVGTDVLGGGVEPLRGLAAVALSAPESGNDLVVNIFAVILDEVDQAHPRLVRMQADEATAAIAGTLAIRVAKEALRLLRARTGCIKSAELNGQEPIFKATVDTEDAAVGLPLTVATSADSFADCVNRLYKLVYESSGDLNRIPSQFKQPDSIVFDLKCLRTYFFHDVHHGEPAKQRKKLLDIGQAFKKLGGSTRAESSIDWERMQLALLSQLADLLDDVDALIAGPSR